MNPPNDKGFDARVLWRYLSPHRLGLTAAGLSMIGRALTLLSLPWPLKFIVDNVLFGHALPTWLVGWLPDPTQHRLALLNVLGLAMLLLGAADAALAYMGNRLLLNIGQRVVFNIRCDLFAHLQRLSLGFHRRQQTGDLMSRLGGDIQTLLDFVVAIATGVFAHVLTIVGICVIMLILDWRYGLLAMLVVPILFTIAQYYTGRLREALRRARQWEGELWGRAQEVISGVHLVQAYGREPHENDRFSELAEKGLDANVEANELTAQFTPLVDLIMTTAAGVIAWYGAVQVLEQHISAGELLVFLTYLRNMAAPVRQFAKIARVVGKAQVAAERLVQIFSEEPEIGNTAITTAAPTSCKGEIELRSVSFGYNAGPMILRNVSLKVLPGQTLALVGATGAGKSTIASLVPRFHDPSAGAVFLDGQDLRTLPLAFVRDQVALVLQDALIFHAPIWENIAYGRNGAEREAAIAAAKAVGVHDLIKTLPDGYDTVVGERGATLSGGQRQCVAIARAMLRQAPIVILDEPTSGLDPISERRLMEALRRLTVGRATIIIAHRLSTIVNADLIAVLEHGQVIQYGTHVQLLAERGRYAELWQGAGKMPASVGMS